ncbi:MAG TPA: transglutaminase N-terminal domain-containing protein, partial [Paracoccaceae bacterium]|nr:transglutaminase N-terminal domain-containing protein [Paracoccaceae bacterium]
MRLSIRHNTRYVFAEPVAHGVQRLRLTPKETQGQAILDWSMSYHGAREELAYDDQNFNHTNLVSVEPGATEVIIECRGTVQTTDLAGVIGRHSG